MAWLGRLGAAALITSIAAGAAGAQAPQPAGPAPQRTTATFEDWTLRCETQGNPPVKNCELVQAVTAPGQTQPVTQIAIGRATPKDPLKIVFQLPVNVWLPTGVSFVVDAKAQPIAATLKWCNPAGCFADVDLANDHVKRMRGATAQGRFTFKDAARRDINIPVSFKGFSAALDALGKQ
jgi:invasion protein IalB